MVDFRIVRWVGLVVALLVGVGAASGQGLPPLEFGTSNTGTLSAESPAQLYVFNGDAGTLVTVQVIGASPLMYPSVSLMGPTQQQLASDDSDPFNLSGRAARVTVRLPQTATYTVLVGGTPGNYVISLDGRGSQPQPLLTGQALPVTIAAGADIQYYTFTSDPAGSTALTVVSQNENSFLLTLVDGDGRLVTVIDGGMISTCTAVPAGDGAYELSIVQSDRNTEGRYDVLAAPGGCAGSTSSAGAVQPPAQTPEVQPSDGGGQSSGGCVASSATNVNIRGGAGTNFDAVGTLFAGQTISVTGSTADGWYQVQGQSLSGYVSQSVVTVSGACSGLPQVSSQPSQDGGQPPAAPNGTVVPPAATEEVQDPQAPPTLTPEPPPDQLAPVTDMPTETPQFFGNYTEVPTATYTPTVAVQEAPPDGNYAMTIPLDGNASRSDVVSYPGGDTEDRVSWSVSGMNSSVALPGGRARLVITVSCFGDGTQYVTFFTGGQSYSCGQTIVDREVTFDSNTSSVQITATGGEGTYVQWVVSGTATRIN